MTRITKNVTALFAVLIFGLSSCSSPVVNLASPSSQSASSRDVVLTPGNSEMTYLGGGRDILKAVQKSQAVQVGEASKTIGDSTTEARNFVSTNSFDLDSSLSIDASAHVNANLFDELSIDASIKNKIQISVKYSSNKIVYVAEIKYDHARITANPNLVSLKPDALTIFQTYGKDRFRADYGDGYVDSVLLGERLFMTMTIDSTKVDSSLKDHFESAANAKFLTVVGGGANVVSDQETQTIWSQMSTTTQLFATGGFIPPAYVATADDFKSDYNAFSTFIQNKVTGANSVPFSVVASSYKSYDSLLNSTFSAADAFFKKLQEWQKARARVEIVYNDTKDFSLQTLCQTAFATIDAQIVLCKNQDPAARYPLKDEFASIDAEWFKLVTIILYEVHVQKYGWDQGWVSAGQTAGTTGQGRRMEAMQIKFPSIAPYGWNLKYQAHVESKGWMTAVANGEIAGTTGKSLRMEAVKIWLENCPSNLHILYRVYCTGIGWQPWVKDGAIGGTTGQSRKAEAIEIKIST